MSESEKLRQARALASRHGQEHLLRYYDGLAPSEREILLDQVLSVDYENLAALHRSLVASPPAEGPHGSIAPLQAKAWEDFGASEHAAMTDMGMRALREGKVAAFLVAGGQGTRLGHDGPKGIFDIGLPSRKSLFQLQAERILRLSRQAGKALPWYVMTSEENHAATVAFFREKKYFGHPEKDVFFFRQGELPVVDSRGKILLASKGSLSRGPNGNGGCFLALSESGALDDMRRRGVEYLFFYSVDNALVRVCDPAFVGFAMQSGLPAASKAVAKASPEEKVGVLCLRDGRPTVLEYSEMTEAMIRERTPEGRLRFDSANVAMHLFTREFLEAEAASPLPYHVAQKKITCLGDDGERVVPERPNAFKFEMFMFDIFPRAKGMAALTVRREEEFAPVKNRDGVDSPATARALVLDLHRKWALTAGLTEEELRGKTLEVSPLVSYAGEGIDPAQIRSQLGNPIIQVS